MASYDNYRCPDCGYPTVTPTNHCTNCGTFAKGKWIFVPAEVRIIKLQKKICSVCQGKVSENIKFCGKCGSEIKVTIETFEEKLKGS